jgi:enhancing lycopene biosynthesis protein 2
MAKVGVILSGCGVYDGSEIHEATFALLALAQAGAEYVCMAPDKPQAHVMNHLLGQEAPGETRNVLEESARIARGKIIALDKVKGADYDAFFLPGGFGAAKNLCSYAFEGADCGVDPEVARVLREAHAHKRPIGMVCIAPVIGAKLLGDADVKLTVGDDKSAAEAVLAMGASHVACPVREAVVDTRNLVVSSPAYNGSHNIAEVYESVKAAVNATLALTPGGA